jgi:hypothetical protein
MDDPEGAKKCQRDNPDAVVIQIITGSMISRGWL